MESVKPLNQRQLRRQQRLALLLDRTLRVTRTGDVATLQAVLVAEPATPTAEPTTLTTADTVLRTGRLLQVEPQSLAKTDEQNSENTIAIKTFFI